MADIKTRDAVKGTIKTLDKAAIAGSRMKSAYAKTKDKAEQGYYAEENSPTEYAADKVSHASGRIKDEGIHQFNKQGQKNAQITRENPLAALLPYIRRLRLLQEWTNLCRSIYPEAHLSVSARHF